MWKKKREDNLFHDLEKDCENDTCSDEFVYIPVLKLDIITDYIADYKWIYC